METIKTTLHYYKFNDIKDPAQAEEYRALCDKLKGLGLKKFATISPDHGAWLRDKIKPLDGQTVTLELKHVFNNQWNTGPTPASESGLRVFDWSEPIFPNERFRTGQWLEQTAEMRETRDNTSACGYCGYQTRAQRGDVFCPKCIDSEYLKKKELPLTRMQAVSDTSRRAELTEAEAGHLLPLYREAQIHGSTERGKARIAAKRATIKADFEKETAGAKAKHDGFLWLMDNGLDVNNCIYYDHTGVFTFGWRQPVGPEVRGAILDVISEFQWPYCIKCDDGKELDGY